MSTQTSSVQAPPRPTALPVNLDAIPDALKPRDQWVLWRHVLRTDRKTGKTEWAKVPFQPNDREARANDPKTWRAFQVVAAHYQAHPAKWDGIGYEFSPDDPFVGIDLDGCRRDDGTFAPWAAELRAKFATPGVPDAIEIIKRLTTYAEVSPSGHGVKLIGVGKLPGKRNRLGNKESGIECYDQGRYFTITGQRVPGTPATVNDISEAFTALYTAIFGTEANAGTHGKAKGNGKVHSAGKTPTDDDIWNAISGARNATKIIALKNGDTSGYPSASEADMALACHLAFYSRDADQIERLMRASALVREKWERSDYLPNTIAGALETVKDFYDWGQERTTADGLILPSGRTEVANAQRLAKRYGAEIRWCDPWGKWLAWDGKRWAVDERRVLDRHAKAVYRSLWAEISDYAKRLGGDDDDSLVKEMIRFAKASGSAHGIENMLKLARSESGIPIGPNVLDTDSWAFNCQNGTLDLRTGQLREHRREDHLTKLSPVIFDPKADCPIWCSFLREIMAGDDELLGFLRRAVGMSLTGVVQDHVLLFCYGTGANGKSTFLGAIQEMMGTDYAMKAPPDLLLLKRTEGHPTERADLAGKRFVACIEAGEGRRLAESLIKELTGGDRIRARRMREDFWEFSPTHKIWLAANHKPVVRGTDRGMWRRIRLIPFTVAIPDERQDKKLPEKLKGELSGVLNWALWGCREWRTHGLGEAAAVRKATAEYRTEMDILGAFLDECCILDGGCEAPASALYTEYRKWAEATGERTITQQAFGGALTERGFVRDRYTAGALKGKTKWLGIGLRLIKEKEPPQQTGDE